MDNTQELTESRPFTAVEFCAGYQGIHLGLKRAIPNLRVVAVSEIEAFPIANMVGKMEAGLLDPAPIWPDLKTFPGAAFYGKVDLLVAGFPCQPFSAAGKRAGDEDPRHLFPYIRQTIIDMQPGRVFLENVEGLISAKLKGDGWSDPEGTSVLLHVLRELERMGYRATAGVFSAAEVGAPHQRKRVFIYAKLADDSGQRLESNPWDLSGPSEREGESPEDERRATSGGLRPGVWPSRPGEPQHSWEPPRVVENPVNLRERRGADVGGGSSVERTHGEAEVSDRGGEDREPIQRQTQPQMGRDADGLTDRLDYAELYSTCDNRTDELRLLGNGVVPATAEKAYRILSERLRGE